MEIMSGYKMNFLNKINFLKCAYLLAKIYFYCPQSFSQHKVSKIVLLIAHQLIFSREYTIMCKPQCAHNMHITCIHLHSMMA